MKNILLPLLIFVFLNGYSQTNSIEKIPGNEYTAENPAGLISGKVTTTDNQPAAFVNISLKGTNKFATTDEYGQFFLSNIKPGLYTIEISMVGLQTQVKEINVKKEGVTQMNFVLAEDAKQLQHVMVTSGRNLNEQVTTIGKLPVQPKDIPQSITIIDRAILERQQVQNLGDALQNVNGVYIMGTTGGYQEEIAARGYSFRSDNTFKNGARFNSSIKTEFSSVEKVEILKGGNAILYGNVGAGGILNIVTKKPKFEQGGEISFRAGSYDLYKPAFDIYGPLAKNKMAAYRLIASYEKAGSFWDVVSSERLYFNPSLLFNAGKKTTILLEGDYLKDDRIPDFGVGAINYTLIDVPRSRFLNVPWAYYNTIQSTATATITHTVNEKIQLRGLASYQNFQNEMFSANRPNASGQPVAADGQWIRGLQKSATNQDYYFASLDMHAKLKTGNVQHNILLGGDVDKYKTTATAFNTYANPAAGNKNMYDTINVFDPLSFSGNRDIPFLGINRLTTSPILRYGMYFQDLVNLLPNVKLLAGARYTYQENQTAVVDSVAKGTKGNINGSVHSAWSPRVGIVYQPWKWTSLFASYTNSFTVNTGVDVYDQALKPSIIDQFELGLKNDFFNGAVSANITAYKIVNSNLSQTALYLADGVTPNNSSNIKELTGETTSKGIELDIMTKPFYGFNIVAGYSYNDMRYTGVNGNNVNGNKEGDRLRYNPGHTANASVFYHFNKDSRLKGFYIGAGAFYTGDRLAGRNPTNNPNNTNKLMPLPDYAIADINAGYTSKVFGVRLKVSNLFDQLSYNAHDDNSINPIEPRQVVATFSYKF